MMALVAELIHILFYIFQVEIYKTWMDYLV